MAATVTGIHLGPDDHASRPAASGVPYGALYYCSDHDLVYINNAGTWGTYLDNTGGSGGDVATDAIWDAAGDLAVGSGADTAARLAIGASDGMMVRRVGGAVAWQGVIGAKVFNSATQNVNTATETALTFDSEDWDTSAFHDTGSNPSRMTIPANMGGKYLACVNAGYGLTGSGLGSVRIRVNGTNVVATEGTLGSANLKVSLSDIFALVPTDYVEAAVYQSSGGTLAVGHGSVRAVQSQLSIIYLGA